ncbi:outer membrane insertion C- signal [Cognatitamlana onchidii]|uniref:outer membrane insertion C- signal n=1 Tax=Cognatitamlana onchidii TaxID=2562860 RepID=UPI0010A6886E|nr:outer membrane insertion C- signal [Algibacter onchidii]
MKKIIFSVFMISSLALSAQELGIRFGDVSGENNVALDGVFDAGMHRIHANISFGKGVGIDALWDLIHKPLGQDNFNWYAGVGPSTYIGDNFFLGASGEIGLEFIFDVPLTIGIDYRPTFWIIENTTFDWGGFGLNVRYRL